jgi:hypothetical protein
MTNTIKGKKGFISKLDTDKCIKRSSTFLTIDEYNLFKDYLKENNTNSSQCLREYIQTLIHK